MNIGIFTKKEDGAIFGSLPTLKFYDVSLEPVAKKGNGPDYWATVEGAELGAAWLKTSKKGKPYLSLRIVIPGQEPVHLAIIQTETAGQYVAVWSEPKQLSAEQQDSSETASF